MASIFILTIVSKFINPQTFNKEVLVYKYLLLEFHFLILKIVLFQMPLIYLLYFFNHYLNLQSLPIFIKSDTLIFSFIDDELSSLKYLFHIN